MLAMILGTSAAWAATPHPHPHCDVTAYDTILLPSTLDPLNKLEQPGLTPVQFTTDFFKDSPVPVSNTWNV